MSSETTSKNLTKQEIDNLPVVKADDIRVQEIDSGGLVYDKLGSILGKTSLFIYNSAKKYPSKIVLEKTDEEEKPSSTAKKEMGIKMIINLLDENATDIFMDQFGESVAMHGFDGSTLMSLDSAAFEQWLYNFLFEKLGTVNTDKSISAAIKILKYRASLGERKYLSVRVADCDGVIMYDLGNKNYVLITSGYWGVNLSPEPPVFKRFPHQKPQVLPEKGGSLDEFFTLINLPDPQQRLLLKVYLVSCFIPNFPHPVLMVYGTQGSAKTTMCSLVKDLVDPSSLETSGLEDDHNTKELIQAASHHWLLVLDNLTYISEKVSDTMSRICTGGGLSKRKHYQNDEDFIYNFQHILVLNGISQVIRKPDLLDRTLFIRLERISDDQRATIKDIQSKFQELKPKLLGSIFDAAAAAMKHYDSIQLNSMPRMADFAKWGCAIANGLGIDQQEFLDAYQANVLRQTEEAIEASPVATVIMEFMQDKFYFKETPTKLLAQLQDIAFKNQVTNSPGWPKDVSGLSRRLAELKPNLKAMSIDVDIGHKENGHRIIILQKDFVEDSIPLNTESVATPQPLFKRSGQQGH